MRNIAIILVGLFLFFGCTQTANASGQSEEIVGLLQNKDYEALFELKKQPKKIVDMVGIDSAYFIGLHYIEANHQAEAIEIFKYGTKKAKFPYNTLCMHQLAGMGIPKESLKVARLAYKKCPGEKRSKLLLAETLFNESLYDEVISTIGFSMNEYKKDLDTLQTKINEECFSASDSSLALESSIQDGISYYYIKSLMAKNDDSYIEYAKNWFLYKSVSKYHKMFKEEWKPVKDNESNGKISEIQKLENIMTFRYAINIRDYTTGYRYEDFFTENKDLQTYQILSDLGKHFFYAASRFSMKELDKKTEYINKCDKLAQNASGENLFLCLFYKARIQSNAKMNEESKKSYFEALNITKNPFSYDNALWYYLNGYKASSKDMVRLIKENAANWHDPEWFDDIFDELAVNLMNEQSYKSFYDIYFDVSASLSPLTQSKYAYITARLLQEGLLNDAADEKEKPRIIQQLFDVVIDGKNEATYYYLLASKRLGKSVDIPKLIAERETDKNFKKDAFLDAKIEGFTKFGFTEDIYSSFLENPKQISSKTILEAVQYLYTKNPEERTKTIPEGLRMLAKGCSKVDRHIEKFNSDLWYPVPYRDLIENQAELNGLKPYSLFGLIRTESLFQRDVVSHASAIGLAQIMPSTGSDIARRLKVEKYDLKDASTNVTFGSFYLADLVKRIDDKILLASCSYNGGLGRVRKWRKANPSMPLDLFLETVPIEETRNYGRYVFTAATMYANLYYNTDYKDVVKEFFDF